MRNRYQITITDYRAARHYTLTQIMLKSLGLGVAGIALMLLFGLLIIHILGARTLALNSELRGAKSDLQRIESERQLLLAEQVELQFSVQERARQLMRMADELEYIENLIGVDDSSDRPLPRRMALVAQTALEKRTMLRSLPSGCPLAESRINSGFGDRLHPVADRIALHGGVDLQAERNTPVFATADGVVEFAGTDGGGGLGKMVKLAHNFGFATVYAHLDGIEVRVGDFVTQGQKIARSGNTGLTSGPHLHYEVRYLGRRLDPRPFLEWSITDYEQLFAKEERVQWDSLVEAIRRSTQTPERLLSQPTPDWSAISP